jgi:hypothetical protein
MEKLNYFFNLFIKKNVRKLIGINFFYYLNKENNFW